MVKEKAKKREEFLKLGVMVKILDPSVDFSSIPELSGESIKKKMDEFSPAISRINQIEYGIYS